MTLHPAARLAFGASVGLGLACNSPTDPNTQRVIGTIDPGLSAAPVIDAPAQVRSNVAFTVTVRTVGSSSCTTPDGGQVIVSGPLVRITPYDQVPDPGHDLFCTRDYAPHPRDLSIKLQQAGPARLRVVGVQRVERAAGARFGRGPGHRLTVAARGEPLSRVPRAP